MSVSQLVAENDGIRIPPSPDTNGANQFNVGVVGGGSGCIGLVGTTSGTSTICGPNAGGGGGSVTNPIVFSNAIQLPALNTAAIQPSGSAGGLYMNTQDFGFISPTGIHRHVTKTKPQDVVSKSKCPLLVASEVSG